MLAGCFSDRLINAQILDGMNAMARKNRKLCTEVRDYVEKWRTYFKDNIAQYHDFFTFVMGSQWDEKEEDLLITYQKIPLQFNKLAPLINHLLGEQIMNTPNLQCSPTQEVPEKIITIRKALIDKITRESDASVAYQNAFMQAAIGGFGAYRVITEYETKRSFNQDPRIIPIRDATRAFWDVSAEHPNKIDGMISGLFTRMSRQMFIKRYGKRIEQDISFVEGTAESQFVWADDESVTICESYKRSMQVNYLYKLSNGDVVDSDEFQNLERDMVPDPMGGEDIEVIVVNGAPVSIVAEKPMDDYTVTYYKTAGDYVLDEVEMPNESGNVVFVDQCSYFNKTGHQMCRPFVKDAQDAQRFINYLGTQIAYLIKVGRYDQFIVSKANIKSPDTQQIWKNPTVIQGGLFYDVDKEGGTKPEQLRPPELSASLTQQYSRAMEDIKSSTGIYSTQMGDYGYEVSGKAVNARTRNSSYNNYVVFNSLNRAIACGGVIINEMIPRLYDVERKIMLDMPDTGMTTIELNKPSDDYGTEIENDMSKGEYKIKLIAGPSMEGQKEEALNSFKDLLTADPQAFQLIADLYAENLPLPNNIELRNRLRTIVPPDVIEAGKTGKPPEKKEPQPNPQLMLAIKEMENKQKQIELKQQELMIKGKKMDADTQLEWQKLENERIETAARLQDQLLKFQAETHRTNMDGAIAHAQNVSHILTHPNPNRNQPTRK